MQRFQLLLMGEVNCSLDRICEAILKQRVCSPKAILHIHIRHAQFFLWNQQWIHWSLIYSKQKTCAACCEVNSIVNRLSKAMFVLYLLAERETNEKSCNTCGNFVAHSNNANRGTTVRSTRKLADKWQSLSNPGLMCNYYKWHTTLERVEHCFRLRCTTRSLFNVVNCVPIVLLILTHKLDSVW